MANTFFNAIERFPSIHHQTFASNCTESIFNSKMNFYVWLSLQESGFGGVMPWKRSEDSWTERGILEGCRSVLQKSGRTGPHGREEQTGWRILQLCIADCAQTQRVSLEMILILRWLWQDEIDSFSFLEDFLTSFGLRISLMKLWWRAQYGSSRTWMLWERWSERRSFGKTRRLSDSDSDRSGRRNRCSESPQRWIWLARSRTIRYHVHLVESMRNFNSSTSSTRHIHSTENTYLHMNRMFFIRLFDL